MNVPIVSKVSERLNAKMVINTKGNWETSENKDKRPSEPNAAPNVTPSSEIAVASEFACRLAVEISTTPIGIPKRVVATIPIRMAPRTFLTISTAVMTKPIKANNAGICVKLTKAGTMPPPVMTDPTPPVKVSAVAS